MIFTKRARSWRSNAKRLRIPKWWVWRSRRWSRGSTRSLGGFTVMLRWLPRRRMARSGSASINALRPRELSRFTTFKTCVAVTSVKSRTKLPFWKSWTIRTSSRYSTRSDSLERSTNRHWLWVIKLHPSEAPKGSEIRSSFQFTSSALEVVYSISWKDVVARWTNCEPRPFLLKFWKCWHIYMVSSFVTAI